MIYSNKPVSARCLRNYKAKLQKDKAFFNLPKFNLNAHNREKSVKYIGGYCSKNKKKNSSRNNQSIENPK